MLQATDQVGQQGPQSTTRPLPSLDTEEALNLPVMCCTPASMWLAHLLYCKRQGWHLTNGAAACAGVTCPLLPVVCRQRPLCRSHELVS